MKICFLTPYYPPNTKGGMEISLSLLADSLAKRGHEVYVFTPNYNDRDELNGKNPKVFRLSWFSDSPFFKTNPLSSRLFVKKIISYERSFDIIDAYSWFQPAKILSEKLKVPYICSIRDATPICDFRTEENPQGYSFLDYFSKRFSTYGLSPRQVVNATYGYFLTRQNLNIISSANCLSFASNALKKIFEKYNSCGGVIGSIGLGEFRGEKIKIDGIDFSKDKVLLYAGRLSEGKGAFFLFKTAKKVISKDKNIKFLFIGDGPLESEISKSKFKKNIYCLGKKSHNFVLNVIRQVRATVIPSIIFEGFPRIGVESVSLGTPAIGMSVGGIPEAIGEAGLIVKAGDEEGLINAILKTSYDEKFYQSLKFKTKEQAGNFLPEKVSDRVLLLYRRALQKANK